MMLRPGSLALVLAVSACAGASYTDDPLAARIKDHYAGAAVEQGGACPTPEIADITRRKVLEAAGSRTVMQIRYTYYDPSVGGGADWDSVLISERACSGTAERAFTLERGLTGPSVVAMSGPHRKTGD